METNVTDVANALANEHPFEESSFMRVLDLEVIHASEFPEYMNVGYDWRIRVSIIRRKYCWVIRRYDGSHTCTRVTISQDHSKLDSNTIEEAIKPLVEADTSIKVKSVIAEVQSKFNYTISYRKEPSTVIHFETMPTYQGDDLVNETHLYEKYKDCLLVANLEFHMMNGVGLISDRHEPINAVVARNNGTLSPPKVFQLFCIRHIESNFLRKFKASHLQKFVVNIGYSRTVREYDMRYQRLREPGEAYTNWLNRISREQYALAFDGGYRWGHMTTNLVECINSVLKGARNLPSLHLSKQHSTGLMSCSPERVEAEARVNARHVFLTCDVKIVCKSTCIRKHPG
ncbi:hypothetical protein Ahy_A08g038489 [Arachis hypogaea]|uniref:MULE transposase domain-containing protein n=1 Tax=Arachis hypogaea TaxID=3818 RepID=A0A445BTK2_ARAHY|nr:hypothetical protein Ahy_A08g038489 [Arachis hypogaea]